MDKSDIKAIRDSYGEEIVYRKFMEIQLEKYMESYFQMFFENMDEHIDECKDVYNEIINNLDIKDYNQLFKTFIVLTYSSDKLFKLLIDCHGKKMLNNVKNKNNKIKENKNTQVDNDEKEYQFGNIPKDIKSNLYG